MNPAWVRKGKNPSLFSTGPLASLQLKWYHYCTSVKTFKILGQTFLSLPFLVFFIHTVTLNQPPILLTSYRKSIYFFLAVSIQSFFVCYFPPVKKARGSPEVRNRYNEHKVRGYLTQVSFLSTLCLMFLLSFFSEVWLVFAVLWQIFWCYSFVP